MAGVATRLLERRAWRQLWWWRHWSWRSRPNRRSRADAVEAKGAFIASVESLKLVAFAAGVPTCVQVSVPFGERSTMKPVSLLVLSVHVRLIWRLLVDGVATKLLGAAGVEAVVAVATLELAESPRASAGADAIEVGDAGGQTG